MAASPPKPLPEPDPTNGFTRTIVLVESRPVLHSQCDYCGLIISGQSTETAWTCEGEHREYCTRKKPAASSSG